MISNKMGRFMAVPDTNATLWQQMKGNMDDETGYIYKWKNPTGHAIVIQDFYAKFKTHTGTATNAVVAFVGTSVEPATVPTGTLIAATVVSTNTQLVKGSKDIELAKDAYIQMVMVTDATTGATAGADAADVTGVVGVKYAMIPDVAQFA